MVYLHKDKEEFINAVNLASEYFHILPIIVEKDYYVTMIYGNCRSDKGLLCLKVEHRFRNVIKQSNVFQRILILQLIQSCHRGR